MDPDASAYSVRSDVVESEGGESPRRRPLDGLRVIDFGHLIAGPLAAMLLADNGADVIHVDAPNPRFISSLADSYYNRGKRRISLDLKTKGDLGVAKRLVASADVVIENFRPGVMTRLGLGPVLARASNPGLIYLSLPGFPSSDSRASWSAWEGVVLAEMAGYLPYGEHWGPTLRDGGDVDDPHRPLFTPLPTASNFGGMMGAVSVVMALIARHRTGRGQTVEVPLSEALLESQALHMAVPGFGDQSVAPPLHLIPSSSRCSDGRYIDWTPYPRQLAQFLERAGVAVAWREEGLMDFAQVQSDPEINRRFHERYSCLIAGETAEHWDAVAAETGIAMSMVRTPGEWLSCEQARASRSVVEVNDPELGKVWMAGVAVDLDAAPSLVSPRHLPDQDHQEVLDELNAGVDAFAPPAATEELERPLDGISVLDTTQVVAGPMAGKLLADFGATVIKIDNPDPDGPGLGTITGEFINAGKRSILLNLADKRGQDLFWRMADHADVILENFAGGTAERYGVGYSQVRERNPGVVYASVGVFSRSGPWGRRRGHEHQGQAATGVSWQYAGEGHAPLYTPYLVNDAGTGALAVFAVGLALLERFRSGVGQRVGGSLSQTSTLHEALYLFAGEPGVEAPDAGGINCRGWNQVQRLYHARDGWLFVGAVPEQVEAICRALDVDATSLKELETALTKRLPEQSAAFWCERLRVEAVGATAVRTLSDVASDVEMLARGSVRPAENYFGDLAPGVAIGPWLSETPPRSGANCGALGSATVEILTELGLVTDIAELEAAGVVRSA